MKQLMEVYFTENEVYQYKIYGTTDHNNQFSNTIMYFHIGYDNYLLSSKFSGQITKFQMKMCVGRDYFDDPRKLAVLPSLPLLMSKS